MNFPYPTNLQFGIHFNTELNGKIENEITLQFHGIYVYAVKLEIGETETLSADLLQPCDCYKQARECEEYIQSIMLDGLTNIEDVSGHTGDTSAVAPFSNTQLYPAYISGDYVYVNVPVTKPMMKEPAIEVYDANGVKQGNNASSLILFANDSTVIPTSDFVVSNFMPGAKYIQFRTSINYTADIKSKLGDTPLYSLVAKFDYNVVFTCEERRA